MVVLAAFFAALAGFRWFWFWLSHDNSPKI
jgi:hypothetical protein